MTIQPLRPQFKQSTEKSKRQSPFSLRLTHEERAKLDAARGDVALGAFIKARLFDIEAQPLRKKRMPSVDQKLLAQMLGKLAASRISQNLNQIARASNRGILPVTPETEADIKQACYDIAVMRYLLMKALGKRVEPPS